MNSKIQKGVNDCLMKSGAFAFCMRLRCAPMLKLRRKYKL